MCAGLPLSGQRASDSLINQRSQGPDGIVRRDFVGTQFRSIELPIAAKRNAVSRYIDDMSGRNPFDAGDKAVVEPVGANHAARQSIPVYFLRDDAARV